MYYIIAMTEMRMATSELICLAATERSSAERVKKQPRCSEKSDAFTRGRRPEVDFLHRKSHS